MYLTCPNKHIYDVYVYTMIVVFQALSLLYKSDTLSWDQTDNINYT